MSLIFNSQIPKYPPIDNPNTYSTAFFDDFIGASYDNEVWTTTGSGSVVTLDAYCGRISIQSSIANDFYFTLDSVGAFSASTYLECEWRAAMTVSVGTANSVECGIESSGAQPSTWSDFYANGNATNWVCRSSNSGVLTTVDSGIAINTNTHLFKIICASGGSSFYLDNVLCAAITTNIPGGQIQPYCWIVANGTNTNSFNADYVKISGGRI
jgi:hypothetical protein